MLTIAVTGHRKLLKKEDVEREIALSLAYFKEQDPSIEALSALATGADTLFAQEALNAGASLKVMLPFALAEYQQDFIKADWAQLEKLLVDCGHQYEVVNTLKTHTPEERNEAYLSTGKKIVDEADVVLAVWDGQPADGKGGTGDIVKYAKEKGKELHIIKGIRETTPEDAHQTRFTRLDIEAIKYKKKRFERVWWLGLFFAVLAVICFALGLVFHFSPGYRITLACFEIGFLSISALVLLRFAKNWKQQFLVLRRDAERLRGINRYKEARIPIPFLNKDRYEQLNKEISNDILDIEQEVAKSITQIDNLPNAKRNAWCLAQDQIEYNHGRISGFEHSEKQLDRYLTFIKIVFFASVGFKFIIELLDYFEPHCLDALTHVGEKWMPYLNGAVIVFPAIFAALEGVKFFGEWKNNITISKSIVAQLTASKGRIMACKDGPGLLKETDQLRDTLEFENSDWATRYREKSVEMPV